MPSAVPNRNNYYTAHHRRPSSQSQTSLPDQIKPSLPPVQSPNRSLVYLPSAAYTRPGPHAQPDLTTTVSSSSVPSNAVDFEASPVDPRDFYRPFQDSYGEASPKGFHQDALRTSGLDEEPAQSRRRKSSAASTQSQESRRLRTARSSANAQQLSIATNLPPAQGGYGAAPPKTLTSRKASFKDLVARFDSSPDDIPPMPSHPSSVTNSRKNSPVVYSNPYQNAFQSAGKSSNDAHKSQRNAIDRTTDRKVLQEVTRQQRPLFGEVVSGNVSANLAGYGILNARRRAGSEGSPMHSPNPVFPDPSRASLEPPPFEVAQAKNNAPSNPETSGFDQIRVHHRRANSEFSSASTASRIPRGTVGTTETSTVDPGRTSAKRISGSKIPVSTRRQSLTSESGPSNSSSRAASKLEHHQTSSSASQGARVKGTGPAPPKPTTRRRPHSPVHIQSPGRHGRKITVTQGEKSPSLRANIIAPPPKISPPLRGSRQRLPVSSATTAASRARMAERFQTMAREQSDKRLPFRRAKPPELTDIDFNARRLKITQALSRSREGHDLRVGVPSSRQGTSSRSQSVGASEPEDQRGSQTRSPEVPALVIQSPTVDNDGDVFKTPVEEIPQTESAFTQSALRALDGQQRISNESPTLGQANQNALAVSSSRGIHDQDRGYYLEPTSAVTEDTADTLNTPIDAEPQVEEPQQSVSNLSLLAQITSMREQNIGTPLSGRSRSDDYSSDHADEESVQLFLRNTTYNMDEEEAVAKGYRDFVPPPPLPDAPEASDVHRDSWTSSIANHSDKTKDGGDANNARDVTSHDHTSLALPDHFDSNDESGRNTAAGDAYTIVNIVLQEQSTSGVVDQQLVDDIYQRILSEEPEITGSNILDEHKVVELCLRELDAHNERVWGGEGGQELTHGPQKDPVTEHPALSDDDDTARLDTRSLDDDEQPPPAPPKDDFPPPSFRTHKYKSSLDSAEDWAETSPSIGDWMKFALARTPESEKAKKRSVLAQEKKIDEPEDQSASNRPIVGGLDSTSQLSTGEVAPIRPPSHSPPPPPVTAMPLIEQTSMTSLSSAPTAVVPRPQVPRRITSLSQMSVQNQPAMISEDFPGSATDEGNESPEQRRLRQRRHVLKELVDTEFTYERDLRVLCDIYKQTAAAALTEDDVKVLFGNVDTVQNFAKDFLTSLKQSARPAYVMERQDRRRDLTRTPTSDRVSIRAETPDLSDAEKDSQTRIGQAFESLLANMETIYKEYIRTRHVANQRLAQLQAEPAVREWLKECSDNSSDITNAWSLDALLVKPIQRITKYPLLLTQLLESTPPDHADYSYLRRAFSEVTDINVRINEVKKHTEIVDQVMNRKRKESDVRAGLTKAFVRRAEKLRQHVGINDLYEDGEYARLKMDYDNNGVHLLIVSKDCQGYIDAVRGWVVRTCEMAAAAEAWVDVGHSNHPEAESKLRQLAIAVRGINSIALPDHTELVGRKVIQPMEKAMVMLERFKTDPKGLIQKREKKLLDYNQAKNKKDRGEKLDRKMTERMEQWEAINMEAKGRMRKLRDSTAALVQTCLANLVQLHMSWLAMIEQKFAAAMAIPLDGLEHVDLIKEWQVDYDFQHAFAMSLGICNGSLLAEAMNLMSFLTPGSTLNGEDSPRQSSWTSGAQRSTSVNSDGSHPAEFGPRYSNGQHSSQSDYPAEGSSFGHNDARNRAASLASGRAPQTPDLSGRSTGLSSAIPNGHLSRPGTSPGRPDESSTQAPRVSLDAPSPSLGVLRPQSPARPGSASTFFSATAGPSNYASQPVSTGSSIFSSAMPMSDSPERERYPGVGMGDEEPDVLFTAASMYEFNIDRARHEGGIPYLTYVTGEIFDVIGERGELWLARNQDDASKQVGWIWNKHFGKLAE